MKKKLIFTIIFSLCALVLLPLTTKADSITTEVSFTIEPGSLELAQAPILSFDDRPVPKTMVNYLKTSEVKAYQNNSSQATSRKLAVRDYRGANNGWSVTAQVTAADETNGHTVITGQTNQTKVILSNEPSMVFKDSDSGGRVTNASLKKSTLKVNKNNPTTLASSQIVTWTLSNTASD